MMCCPIIINSSFIFNINMVLSFPESPMVARITISVNFSERHGTF